LKRLLNTVQYSSKIVIKVPQHAILHCVSVTPWLNALAHLTAPAGLKLHSEDRNLRCASVVLHRKPITQRGADFGCRCRRVLHTATPLHSSTYYI